MKKFLIIFIFIVIAGLAGFVLVGNFTYSEGSRTGYLMKFSKKGFLFKTYEGELNLGGMNAQNNTVLNNIWAFSVKPTDMSIIDSLANFEGAVIKLKYKQKLKNMPWQGDTPYFVYEIEPIDRAMKSEMDRF
jgi:hypothetical protein